VAFGLFLVIATVNHPESVYPESVYPESVYPESVYPESVYPETVYPGFVGDFLPKQSLTGAI
jgi:hypothetical protein